MSAPAPLTQLQLTALQNEIGNFYTNSVQHTLSDPALTAMNSAINIFINSPSLVRNTVISELNSLSATISSYNTGSSAVFEELSSLVIAENALIQINGFYGQAGSHGPSGPVGLKGIQGSQGPVGDKGDQGLQGPQGDQGPQGIQGSPGIPGNPGAFSAQVQGFADRAAASATAASASEASATTGAIAGAVSAAAAAASAITATTSATAANSSASDATASATAAITSEANSANSALASAASATAAANSVASILALELESSTFATNAAASATASANSAAAAAISALSVDGPAILSSLSNFNAAIGNSIINTPVLGGDAPTTLSGAISSVETAIGSTALTTTAQTLSGAVNELDAKVGKTTIAVSPLGATATSTISTALNNLNTAIGDNSLIGGKYIFILTHIKSAVAALTGSFSKNDIAVAIATAIGAGSDSNLINGLSIDFDASSSLSASDLQANIANLTGTDGPSITASLYGYLPSKLSYIQGIDLLSSDITSDHINNSVDYATILSAIKSAVSALTGSFSKNDIAVAIATAIGASNDTSLISYLEIDFDHTSWVSASQLYSSIARLTGTDGPSIAVSLYNNLYSASSNQGLNLLSSDITSDHINNSVDYATILSAIKLAVAALNGSFSKNDIAVAIATAIGASNDTSLINYLEMDFSSTSWVSASQLQSSVSRLSGTDGPSIAISLYNNLNPESYNKGLALLSNAITADNTNNSINYVDILSTIKSTVAALTGSFNKNDIAVAIATAIGAASDSNLINDLKIDFDANLYASASQLQSIIANLSGTDGPSIASSLYGNLSFTSSLQGANLLSSDIENASNLSLSAAIGNTAINTAVLGGADSDTLSDAVSKAQTAIGSGALNSVGLIGNSAAVPASLAIAVNNINSAIGNSPIMGKKYPLTILANIKSAVAALTGSFSKSDIAVAIATAIGASNDSNLINYLTLDFDNTPWFSAPQLQSYIANISGTNGPSIAINLYSTLYPISFYQGIDRLSSAITSDHNNNSADYANILSTIQSAVAALTGSFSKNDIAVAIATAIGSASDIDLISELEIDFDTNAYTSASQLQSSLANLAGTDGPSIASSLYGNLPSRSSSIQGIDLLSSAIVSDHSNNFIDYANIVSEIKSAVAALTGSFSKNDIVIAIATAIGAGNDNNLINDLKIDFDNTSWVSATQFQSSIATLAGTDGPSIAVSLYNNLYSASSNQGLNLLSSDITSDHINNSVDYANIVSGIKSAVAALTTPFSKNDIVIAIATAIGASRDSNLINYLKIDFDANINISATQIQSYIANLAGTDGPTIALSLYSNLYSTSYIQGLYLLSSDIENISNISLTDAIGDSTISTRATTISGAINELDAEIGSSSIVAGTLGIFTAYGIDSTCTTSTFTVTGEGNLAGKILTMQKCNNWAHITNIANVDSVYYNYGGGCASTSDTTAGGLFALCMYGTDH